MTRFQYINTNLDRIRNEIKLGLISTSILRHYAIYSRYDYYRKLGNPVTFSITLASDNLNIGEREVYKIKKEMENEL